MHTWNLGKWLDALGMKRQVLPEVVPVVQPVVVLGDHRGLVSQVLAPRAWMGADRSAVVGAFSAFQLTSRAPGGTFIRNLTWGVPSGTRNVCWRVTSSPGTLGNLVAGLLVSEMGSTDTVSRLAVGTLAAAPTLTQAPLAGYRNLIGDYQTMWFPRDFAYIRPGDTFEAWQDTVNTGMIVGVDFEDCPALPGAR